MDNDTYDDRIPRMNYQTNIKFLKQQEFNANIVKRLESIEDFREQTLIRLNQEIENRTKAFDRIEELKEDFKLLEQYTVKGLTDSLRELQYNVDVKLERIDDILVVHRNQTDNQRKNFCALRRVLDDKVMDLLEGKHGKQE